MLKYFENKATTMHPLAGKKQTLEHIEKRTTALRGKKRSDESKQKMRESQLKYIRDNPHVIEERRKKAIEQWNDPVAREEARKRALNQMSNPENRLHLRNINLGKIASEETRKKISISQKIIQSTTEMKKRQSEAHRGSKSHLWRGGITSLAYDIRHSFMMRDWITNVFRRDGYSCTKCGKSKCYLNAHHIVPFAKLVKQHDIGSIEDAEKCGDLWDINNGKTLCKECHRKYHKFKQTARLERYGGAK